MSNLTFWAVIYGAAFIGFVLGWGACALLSISGQQSDAEERRGTE